MSKQVDERVVEMRFDNKQFESATKESMSTLDKLKQKLRLKDATKGLDDLEKAAKKVDLNPLGKSAEMVTAKFSAMQVAGMTAIANLTNSAINAGKNITKALTIEPVITGFQEYETQIGAIQTILANTQKEGTNVERVNAALDELNLYADQTIYNFTEMTRNIGTFTAAGVKLDDSVSAIKGIANLAAVSGSTSLQASTAMYQLSQALAAGKVSLMDWNSVVNAGMGGQVFQDALIRTSENLKTGAKEAIATYGTFRESLTQGAWLTTEVLTETLGQLAGAYSEADLLAKGYSAEQAKEIVKLAETAKGAATDVKTFTQLWDTLKEAVQSGWGQTWRMIVGDFDEAKERMTKLSTLFGGIIEKSSNRRNSMLSGALDSSWSKLTTRLSDAGIKTEDFQNKIIELAKTHNVNLDEMIEKEGSFEKALRKAFSNGKLDKSILMDAIKSFTGGITESANAAKVASGQMEKYHEIANKVINGDFGNGAERVEKLTAAGYEYAAVQNIVNEKLGSSVRHMSSLTDEQIKNADSLANLSDEQLKTKGYTDEQIVALKDLKKEADDAGSSIYKLINGFEKPSGVELAWSSVFNILDSITESCKAVKKAWTEIFHPGMTEDQIIAERSERLYKLIEAIHSFTERLKVNEDTAQKITRTFKGLFAILDLIRMVVGGAFSIAFRVLKEVLSAFDMDVLDLTANIGDAIVKFHDWVTEHNLLAKAIKFVVPYIKEAVIAVKDWVKSNETIQNGIKKLRSAFNDATKGIREWINNIKEADNIPKYILQGLVNGIKSGIGTAVTAIVELGKSLLEGIKNVLGIHSPSTEFFEIGKNIIAGLINGIKEGVSSLLSLLGDIGQKCVDTIGKIDFSKVFTLAISAGIIFAGKKIYDLMEKFAAPMEGLGKMFGGIGHMFNSLGKVLDNFAGMIKIKKYEAIAKMFLNFGIAIGIMAASIYVLSTIDTGKLWSAVGAVTAMAIVMVGLSLALSKFSDASATIGKDGLKISGVKTALISLGIAIVLIAAAVKMIGTLKPEQAIQGFLGLVGIVVAMGAAVWAFGTFAKGKNAQNIDKFGVALFKMSAAMLLMVVVIKLLGGMSPDDILKGVSCIVAFGGVMVGLAALTKLAGKNIDKVGTMMLKISAAMTLMAVAVKIIATLSPEDMLKGGVFMAAFLVFVKYLIKATTIAKDQQIAQITGLVISISAAMMLMALACKLIATLSPEDMLKGGVFMAAFLVFVKYLIKATTIANDQQIAKVASTILAVSVAIGILAAVSVLLGLVDIATLAKGVTAVTILGGIMTAMIWATRGAENVKGNIIAMTVAIGVMAAAVAVLSFIDTSKLAGATAALSILMVMFGVMAKLAGNAQGAIGPLIVITAAVVAIGGVLYALASLPDTGAALTAAIAVTLLMGSMTAMLYVLNVVGQTAKQMLPNVLVGIAGLLAMCIPLMAFIEVLKQMNGIENAERNAIILAAFMTAMTVLLLAVTGIGYLMLGSSGLAGIAGLIGLAAMLAELYIVVDVLRSMDELQNAETNVEVLVKLMTTLEHVLTVVAILGPLALVGSTAVLALIGVITVFGAFAAAVGKLMEKFPSLEELIDKGIPILEKVANGLGSVIGNIIAGFGAAVTSTLPTIGENIRQFVENISVDKSVIDGVKSLAKALAIITGASILDAIAGGDNMIEFGKQLESFGESLSIFGEKTKDIKPAKIKAAASAGKALAETASELPFDIGHNNLRKFGEELAPFGQGLNDFAYNVRDVKPKTVIAAAKAGKALAETADELPFDIGHNNLLNFAAELAPFGQGLNDFAYNIRDVKPKTVIAAAKAGKKLAETASELPFDIGHNNLLNFAAELAPFGQALNDFAYNVRDVNPKVIESAAKAGKNLAETADELPFDWGDDNLSEFGKQLAPFGEGLSNFHTSVKDINPEVIESAAKAAKNLAETADEIPTDWGNNNLIKFGEQLSEGENSFGKALSSFCGEFENIDAENVNAAATTAKNLVESLTLLSDKDIDAEKIPDLNDQLTKIGNGLKGFVNATGALDQDTLSKAKAAAETGKTVIDAIRSMVTSDNQTLKLQGGSSNYLTAFDEIDLTGFGQKINEFGQAIINFSSAIGDKQIDPSVVTSAAEAGSAIISAIRNIAPNIEDGEQNFETAFDAIDLSTLSGKMGTFGLAIGNFVKATGDITNVEAAVQSAEVGAKAVEAVKALAEKIGEDETTFNSIDLTNFETQMTSFGKGIQGFAGNIPEASVLETVKTAVESANSIIEATNKIGDTLTDSEFAKKDENGLNAFTENMKTFGAGLNDFSNAMPNVNNDRITAATDAVNSISTMSFPNADAIAEATVALGELVTAIQTMAGLDSGTIETFNTNLAGLGETGIAKFVDAFAVPNDTVTQAINGFVTSAASTVDGSKETIKKSGEDLGKALVDGFAKGINDNTYKAEAKAKNMAKASYDAARAELNVNSPSKKFMKVGSSVVEGFAKGITKNVGDANKASVKMANGVLKATQDELGIHSPSVVFKEEVGRYIVQGIAEGITSDMSAEEAAEQKANNIINAFKKVIDSNNLDSDIAKNAFDIWSIGEGKYASGAAKDAKQLEYLTGQIPRDSKNVQLANDKWLEMKANFGATDDRTKEAYKELQAAIIAQQDTIDAIEDISKNASDRQNSIWEQEKSNLDADYDLWESMYGDYVSEKTKNAQRRSTLIKKVAIQDEKVAEANRKLTKYEQTYGKDSLEWKEQYEVYKSEKQTAYDLRNEIKAIDKETRESVKEAREIEQSIADTEYDTWLKTIGRNATEAEKDAKHLENLNSTLVRQNADLLDAEKEYERLCLLLGKDSAEAQKQLETVTQFRNDIATTNDEIYQTTEDAIQREKDLLREQQDLVSDTADLQYQIWEKIFGRDATDAEKDTAKLGTLNKQAIAQSNILAMVQKNLEEAINTYGSDSIEAQRAYNEYLQEEYNLAQLHSDILDVEESIADREKSQQERQRNAKNEYLDYMDKYKQYYLDHGMTLEELENDAKLVSGYDPDKLINKTISDASKSVSKVVNGHEYSNILSNFSDIGTSYATSMSEGVSSGTPQVISSATTMVSECTTTLKEAQPTWIDTGSYLLDGFIAGLNSKTENVIDTVVAISDGSIVKLKLRLENWYDAARYLVDGFIAGIRSKIVDAAYAAAEMARAALAAAEEALDINSPSKEFARVGAYAVMGMVEGLKNNSYLVADAATNVGDVAIENLKNSIKNISDVVNSEIDTQPTIRPVLDLSDITSKASKLNAMTSRALAANISSDMTRTANLQNIQNGTDTDTASGNTYQFTQNNYSPKALSRIEIYRQTKNQFAMMKGMV